MKYCRIAASRQRYAKAASRQPAGSDAASQRRQLADS